MMNRNLGEFAQNDPVENLCETADNPILLTNTG